MPRKPRIHVPGGVYHVMLRGNGGQPIFFSDEDRSRFLLLLQEGTSRFGYRVHGYCLMGNHVHLVLQVADIPLSRSMQNLAFRYTRWVNQRQDRIGHLFQGRYKAILVDQDAYLLPLVRYVHLNPVRAGLVDDPKAYPWSSHRPYLGMDAVPWLTTDWVLGCFAAEADPARQAYAAFVSAGTGTTEDLERGSADVRILGGDTYLEKVLDQPPRDADRPDLEAIVSTVCRNLEVEPSSLAAPGRGRKASHARAVAAWLARDFGTVSLTQIAKEFNRDLSTLSRAVSGLEREMATSDELRQRIASIKSAIAQA